MTEQSSYEQNNEIATTVLYTWDLSQISNSIIGGTSKTSPTFSDEKNKYKFQLILVDGLLGLKSLNEEELIIRCFTFFSDMSVNPPINSNLTAIICTSEKKVTVICSFRRFPTLVINFILIVIKQRTTSIISERLDIMFENMKFSDVTLIVQGKEFPAHKVFLASISPVFNAMFESDMEESKTNRVFIEDFSHEAIQEMLRFVYTGKVENLDGMEFELLGIAEKYALEELKKMCEEKLVRSLSMQNACGVLQIADLYNAPSLKAKAVEFINNNALIVTSSISWVIFAKKNPKLVEELYLNLSRKQWNF